MRVDFFVTGWLRRLSTLLLTGFTLFLGIACLSSDVRAAPDVSAGLFTLVWSSFEIDHTTSLAWGDYDGDGDLDLVVGNDGEPNRLYRNDGGILTLVWSSLEVNWTYSLAWGDYDGDGDLDLAVGNYGQPNRLYRNDGGAWTLAWSSPEVDYSTSIAWGDYDGNGDLDLAVGNDGQPNRLYRNDGGALTLAWSSPEVDYSTSIAWGDYDGDGDLDLAVGNSNQPNRVYRNDGGALNLAWLSAEADDTRSVAWGDYDGDGDLDLAVGNWGTNRVYRNDGGALTLAWSSTEIGLTRSLGWGDYDNDGDIDLAVGYGWNQSIHLYRNDGGTLTLAWLSIEANSAGSLAWGDYDSDGDLDLAVGNTGPNRVYRNDGGAWTLAWSSVETDLTHSIAWGDYDSDGDLDLAVGNEEYPNRLYRNDGGAWTLAWSSVETDLTHSIAWGDYDSDGDLDLAVGYGSNQSIRLYCNDGSSLTLAWSSTEADYTTGLAWGDYDSDGDLDLAVGNLAESNRLYRNDGGVLTLAWSSVETDLTYSIAWGDYDGDGDLDLAVGNEEYPNRVYRNDGGVLTLAWSSVETDLTHSIAWGDYDGDGDLDLAVGNCCYQPNRLYRNDGGALTLAWSSPEADDTSGIAWGDYDGDGDLDLAVGNGSYQSNRLYHNDGGALALAWSSVEVDNTTSVAWGDYDGDGDLDLAVGNDGQPNRIYRNDGDGRLTPGSIPTVYLARLGLNADGFSDPRVWSRVISVPFTLSDPQSDPVSSVHAWYSLNGGGRWIPAVATSGTITTNLASSPTGVEHVFNWDVNASGFFGQSDNIVFRIQAVPSTVNRPNSVPGPYLYGSDATSTFPFRVRGNQVRVLENDAPVSNAVVYRLPVGQEGLGEAYANLAGEPFHTDGQGYLQGRGEIQSGDQLVALAPISTGSRYTLYHTSATSTTDGLAMYTVTSGGVQTLTVSSANSLLLFDLDVFLDWDARYDQEYLTRLESNIKRTSELLFDWSNGQAALGKINVYHNREHWNDAQVHIYATNRLRPSAAQGGIVSDILTDTLATKVVYVPGMVHIGATWNRFGDPGANLGDDWPRTLAHELGHYLLFLDDNYLGFDPNGLLIPIENCPGAMSDPYSDDDTTGYDEHHPNAAWLPNCQNTLSNQATGRSDWQTIQTFYPWIAVTNNPGPNSLPLAVTQVNFVEPNYASTSLPVPLFYLRQQEGGRYTPTSSARAYLFQDDRLTDLGSPTLDQVLARGAREGERLCVFDVSAGRLGCESIAATDETLDMVSLPDWQPEVIVTPVTSRTVEITATLSGVSQDKSVYARLYSLNDPAGEPLVLTQISTGVYRGTFQLAQPTYEGFVHVWVNEPGAERREIVTDYAVGGDPGPQRGRAGNTGPRRGNQAPVVSTDGQAILVGKELHFAEGEFYVLQTATRLPQTPAWVDVVGQGYWLSASVHAPNITGASLAFNYLGSQVSESMENWLKVYHWNGAGWEPLPTQVDTYQNYATTPVRGPGLYALMASIEIPLYGPGWDAFSYPVNSAQPVSQTLQSIAGSYETVYWYDGSNKVDPWKVYDVDAPDWVNDLNELRFVETYWISLTQAITLNIATKDEMELGAFTFPSPPATYYGKVLSGGGVIPESGMQVTAWVDDNLCGQGWTRDIQGEIVYSLNVFADGLGHWGCGSYGKTIKFKIEANEFPPVFWNNNDVWYFPLDMLEYQVYLPILLR